MPKLSPEPLADRSVSWLRFLPASHQFGQSAMPMAKLAAQAATPIEPGQQTVEATVSVRWFFIPGR